MDSSFPKVLPVGRDLTPQQKIALSARMISDAGMALDVAGHITEMRDDGTMLSTPYGKWWFELQASDMLILDSDGSVLEGNLDVTPAIHIHTEIHRRRPDARVIIHNHPHYSTLLSSLHMIPEIIEQQAVIFDDEVVLFDEFTGGINDVDSGRHLADTVGDKGNVVLLANHGLLTFAETLEEATYRFFSFERSCKFNYEAMASGRKPVTVPEAPRREMKEIMKKYNHYYFWNGAARQVLANDDSVLG
ncbi:class II aldolase/adducin family protein [Rhodococcus sp. T2V]|uniref:class II aldolase/adducin family protein n=1 Tax=Rhodococcus sp. T2V TaxID=3034164 RepID=UPI0023E2D8D8|nr:class II aldolase/adducin family protein [Rhodococcus sp. T2V]MDF3312229.1 class II aldolase/adducin family protein [Rhodococcus sp. T2V]